MINAKILADSISYDHIRLVTVEVSLPKCLLAELHTHRVFSKNFSSSRAIPVNKLAAVEEHFSPLYWGKNQSGMQAKLEEIDDVETAKKIWADAIEYCQHASQKLSDLGLHKQWANRLNDWHSIAHGVLTSTQWANFFHLRISPTAQPEMCEFAKKIKEELDNSQPVRLSYDDWHLPYVHLNEKQTVDINDQLKLSVARCASVSYKTVDGQLMDVDRALSLYDKLYSSSHFSPFEHQATPDHWGGSEGWACPELHGNLTGWKQYRHTIPNNTIED